MLSLSKIFGLYFFQKKKDKRVLLFCSKIPPFDKETSGEKQFRHFMARGGFGLRVVIPCSVRLIFLEEKKMFQKRSAIIRVQKTLLLGVGSFFNTAIVAQRTLCLVLQDLFSFDYIKVYFKKLLQC